ncbi:MAG TPA: DEAD/DEAH box helicase [Chloroflexia bacterium]|nr:DEAD/DEAH box helicase [Chloroflexia bacterium]
MTNLLEKELNFTEETQNPEVRQLTFNRYKLPGFLREGLKRAGFVNPTTIQAQAIPVLLEGKDLVGQSHTGSGKTAAFAIPLLARINRQSRDLQAMVIVPTRELAIQVTTVVKTLAGPAIRVTPIYGGASMEGQIRGLNRGGYQAVVGTPGRIRDHLNRGTMKLGNLQLLVLDEADEMLDRGFAQDIEAIIQSMPQSDQRQTALFSATLPEWVMDTARKHLRPDYASIELEPTPESRPDIEHLIYDMKLADKGIALRHLLDTHFQSPILVFARTKHGVKKLSDRLEREGYSVAGLQGNLSQRAREEVMSAFRNNRIRIMVATNVGARGLDVSGVSHVINYDLPESAELFTHRVGRTGRNGASGTAITFLTSEDRPKWREIERAMQQRGIDLDRKPWDGPRAEPGSEPEFIQPKQRSFSGNNYDRRPGEARPNFSHDNGNRRERSTFSHREESFDRDFPRRKDNFERRERPAGFETGFEGQPERTFRRKSANGFNNPNDRGFKPEPRERRENSFDRPAQKRNSNGFRQDRPNRGNRWER